MSQKYSAETREILADFLRALEERDEFDPRFLAELRHLADTGQIGHRSQVKQVVRLLEAGGHEHED